MVAPYPEYAYFVTCARELEPLLADELRALRCRGVRPQRGGVLFRGTIKDAYRVCLWSRLASRVLLQLADVPAESADALYAGIHELAWEEHLAPNGTLQVQTTGTNGALRNTQFTNVKVKDAIADRFRERTGSRPSVETVHPDLTINVLVRSADAKISLDLSGEPLHRRGYRQDGVQVEAPMKETLAAAMLTLAEWPRIARSGGAFVDFLCGSGTLALEAALMAGDIAPGLLRKRWGFSRWLKHDEEAFAALMAEAEERRERGIASLPPVVASDFDARAIEIARRSVRRVGLERAIDLRVADMRALDRAATGIAADAPAGLLALNPPYGKRLATTEELWGIYRDIAATAERAFNGWSLALISPDASVDTALGWRPRTQAALRNGAIPVTVDVFTVGADSLHIETEPFANRLAKMARHYGSWARKAGVSCYRIYDADLPDFNCAIDLYHGAGPSAGKLWVVIAEYAPPAQIEPAVAAARMEAVAHICREYFADEHGEIVLKRRTRQRGAAQYERIDEETGATVGIVEENGLLFEVNFSDYLDTGLFLDHRDLRAYLRERAVARSFLNLFAYTGTASVYAAAGGALSTCTVDLSRTYLDAARRNLVRNGLLGEAGHDADTSEPVVHRFEQADVLAWIDEARARAIDPDAADATYGLIFCDPPTFSNSKRMETTWDVVRDHVALLSKLGDLLTDDGLLVFSTNKRGFVLDEAALAAAGFVVIDLTKRTMPRDFAGRTTPIHHAYLLQRSTL